MTGTDKLPLLIIGKSARPRGFPKEQDKLPVTYRSNRTAWMTGVLWEEWIRKLDDHFARKKRNILLLIDNCTAHIEIPYLKSLKVEFLPPNLTSLLQPMDQGVIRNFKAYYRRTLIQKLLDHIEKHQELLKVKLIESVFMSYSAWQQVTPTTIANCFSHAGLSSEEAEIELLDPDFNSTSQAAFGQLMSVLGEDAGADSMESYFQIDNEVPVCTESSEESILLNHARQVQADPLDSGTESEVEVTLEVNPDPEIDVFNNIESIRAWSLQSSAAADIYFHLAAIERIVMDTKLRHLTQKRITDYFPPTN